MQIEFRRLLLDTQPGPGEALLVQSVAGRRELALGALRRGIAAFPARGPVKTLVLPADPTLDDMLASRILVQQAAGQALPEGLVAFAHYSALVREGLSLTTSPLEQSLEGIYLAVRNDGGEDLSRPDSAARFGAGWERIARRLWALASECTDPFARPFADGTHEFARETSYLAQDREVFELDCARGAQWPMRREGWPEGRALLLWQPASILFKHWARRARAQGPRWLLLAVHADGAWTISTNPAHGLSLLDLAGGLRAAEERCPDAAAGDPWFDGAPFRHTIVGSPRSGSRLSVRAVEGLLRAWGGAPLPEDAETTPTPRLTPHGVPAIIDEYELGEVLGEGGTGIVFRARQPALDRDVAVKVLSLRWSSDATSLKRFDREVRAAATIRHFHVVTVLSAGVVMGRPYLAMELFPGGDAQRLMMAAPGGRLPERRALEIVRDATRGLAAFEALGLVHRDIKPSNIFITDTGAAKLADLGMVRHESGDDRITLSGYVVGTPQFMSPEQADADAQVDVRTDIYALGATLYALLCGCPPFRGSFIQVLAQIVNKPAPDPREIVPDISDGTASLIGRCLLKDPDQRPLTSSALLAEIEACLAATG